MSINHTEEFQKQLDDFNDRMGNGKVEKQQKLFQESIKDAPSEVVIQFVMDMSSEQLREVRAQIKARNIIKGVKGYIGNREVYDYCKEFDITPDKTKNKKPKEDPKKHYHLLEEFQDFKIDNRDCFVKSNDVDNKVMVVIFDDNNEVRTIKY
jgi:hypothetical protein